MLRTLREKGQDTKLCMTPTVYVTQKASQRKYTTKQ